MTSSVSILLDDLCILNFWLHLSKIWSALMEALSQLTCVNSWVSYAAKIHQQMRTIFKTRVDIIVQILHIKD